jgi:hypothetical protein
MCLTAGDDLSNAIIAAGGGKPDAVIKTGNNDA